MRKIAVSVPTEEKQCVVKASQPGSLDTEKLKKGSSSGNKGGSKKKQTTKKAGKSSTNKTVGLPARSLEKARLKITVFFENLININELLKEFNRWLADKYNASELDANKLFAAIILMD